MKKILIIENEFHSIKAPISVLESKYKLEQDKLIYQLYVKSQDVAWDEVESFNAILIDLSLAAKSEMDGYSILKKIKNEYPEIVKRTAIITGNGMVGESLKEKGIGADDFKVFTKPLKYMELKNFIDSASKGMTQDDLPPSKDGAE